MTKEQLKEFTRCANDFFYFAETYLKITNPSEGLISFKLYDFQKKVIKEFESNRYSIISKFRQAGITTLATLWGLWLAMFKTDQRIMLLSKSDREATGAGETVQTAIDYLPDWLRPNLTNGGNLHEKRFDETNSVMWFYNQQAARSKSLTHLIVDEAAFIPKMQQAWSAMFPTISVGGKCMVISTVNGIGGMGKWFADQYMLAKEGLNKFKVIDLDYTEHPEYKKPGWAEDMLAQLGEKSFRQEILRDFLGSGDTYIPPNIIMEIDKKCTPPIRKLFPEWDTNPSKILKEDYDLANEEYERGSLWIWQNPQPGKSYILSGDTSDGVGGTCDYTAFHVIEENSLIQVAEFYSNTVDNVTFAQIVSQVGLFYNDAYVVIENENGSGSTVLDRLENIFYYPNIHYSTAQNGRQKIGFAMNRNSRQLVCETIKSCIINNIVTIRSSRTCKELKTFIYDFVSRRAQHASGEHDDLVISLGIGLCVAEGASTKLPAGFKGSSINTSTAADKFNKLFLGQSLENIKYALQRNATFETISQDQVDGFYDLLPEISRDKLTARPNESLLREFGM